MHFVYWIVLGLIAGFIASMLVNKKGEGMLGDIILGIIGAVVGGFIMHSLGYADPTNYGLSIPAILVAAGGAVLVLIIYHALRGQRAVR